jgi:hypothetical protein
MSCKLELLPLMTVAILAVVLLAPVGAQASEGDCDPIIHVHLSREDQQDGQTTLVFAVAVDVHENRCSKVHFELVIETSDAAGKSHREALARSVKVTDREISQKVNYKVPRGRSLVKYEVESITCYECGNEP